MQRFGNIRLADADPNLFQIAGVSAQDGHLSPAQSGRQHQPVKAIIFHFAQPDFFKRFPKARAGLVQINGAVPGHAQQKIVNPDGFPGTGTHQVRVLTQYPQPQVFHDGNLIGQGQWFDKVVQLQMHMTLMVILRLVKLHGQWSTVVHFGKVMDIRHRRLGAKSLLVGGVETIGKTGQQLVTAHLAKGIEHPGTQLIVPGGGSAHDLMIDHLLAKLHAPLKFENKMHPGQHRLGKIGGKLAVFRP